MKQPPNFQNALVAVAALGDREKFQRATTELGRLSEQLDVEDSPEAVQKLFECSDVVRKAEKMVARAQSKMIEVLIANRKQTPHR